MPNWCAGKIRKLWENRQHDDNTNTVANVRKDDSLSSTYPKYPREVIARIYVLEDILEECSASLDRSYFDLNSVHSCAYVSESLRITLEAKTGSRVIIERIEETEQSRPTTFEIFPFDRSVTMEDFVDYVKLYSAYQLLLLNSSSIISFDDGKRCVVRILPVNCNYATVDERIVKKSNVHVQSVLNSSGMGISVNSISNLQMDKLSMR